MQILTVSVVLAPGKRHFRKYKSKRCTLKKSKAHSLIIKKYVEKENERTEIGENPMQNRKKEKFRY